jgi:hypothetical protein
MFQDALPSTAERVPLSTSKDVNEQIRRKTLENINKYSLNKNLITARLKELDYEWDTERFLEANASTIVLITVFLGLAHSVYWFFLTGLVAFFLLLHAIQGWCPPLPFIRKRGFRTADEINEERIALKFIRGDFEKFCSEPKEFPKSFVH